MSTIGYAEANMRQWKQAKKEKMYAEQNSNFEVGKAIKSIQVQEERANWTERKKKEKLIPPLHIEYGGYEAVDSDKDRKSVV